MIVENELGVIVEFARQAYQYGFEILEIGSAYPDAVIKKDGVAYRAEFEFRCSHFNNHKHDIRQCDLIICWENDYEAMPLPVIELSNPEWFKLPILGASPDKKDAYYWKMRAYRLEKKLNSLIEERAPIVEIKNDPVLIICPKPLEDMSREEKQNKIKELVGSGVKWAAIAKLFNDWSNNGSGMEARQEVVGQMMKDGLTNEQMAEALGVSMGTVKNDKRAILQRDTGQDGTGLLGVSLGTVKNDKRAAKEANLVHANGKVSDER